MIASRVALVGLVVFVSLVASEDKPNELKKNQDPSAPIQPIKPVQPFQSTNDQEDLANNNSNSNNNNNNNINNDQQQLDQTRPADERGLENNNINYEVSPPNQRDQQPRDNGFGFHRRRQQSFDNNDFSSPFSNLFGQSPFGQSPFGQSPFGQSPFNDQNQGGLMPRPGNFLSHLLGGGSDLFDSLFRRSHDMMERRFKDISSQPLGVSHEQFTRNGVTYVRTCETKRLGDDNNSDNDQRNNHQQQQPKQQQQQQPKDLQQPLEEQPASQLNN